MVDVVDPATRSRMMSGIRGKNTKPEILVRKALHKQGFRYRLHVKDLPGKPDLVFPKYNAVIFVHGCFWHGHNCKYFKVPKTRTEFWLNKINDNRRRDRRVQHELAATGWRIAIVWECSVRSKINMELLDLANQLSDWLRSDSSSAEFPTGHSLPSNTIRA
jgi:DNA mismatch endonuclease (patch repair protein)